MSLGLKLDASSHDIVFNNGKLDIVSDNEKTAQDIKTRLKILKGEYILNSEYGMEYKVIFDLRAISLSEIETLIKRYILDTPNVRSIIKFFLKHDGGSSRNMSVTFSVETESGYELLNEVSLNVWNG